jgi:hypothetical protein
LYVVHSHPALLRHDNRALISQDLLEILGPKISMDPLNNRSSSPRKTATTLICTDVMLV